MGIASGGNAYIIGIFLMYISWVVVYFTMIKPNIKPKDLYTSVTN